MKEKIYNTGLGSIHYWVNYIDPVKPSLIFLPGLTVDHRLFDRQIEHFKGRYNVFVWDAPGHGLSWPFKFDYDLMDMAKWLYSILEQEEMPKPLIIGHSMGGHLGQTFAELYPDVLKGFISINSGPLQRKYMTSRELWLLKRMKIIYRLCPWKLLLKISSRGVAVTNYGRRLMYDMMMTYSKNHARDSQVACHGFKILAEAIEKDLPYAIKCPALLICGKEDKINSIKRCNAAWHKETQIPLHWIKDAGHNANTDQPEIINNLIETFVKELKKN
ncbi:MAG: alpha/beta fold hydrolase [Christensenellales bacterium]|jgi:pimeloyl-ACP methyl ester carboxylesterase